MKLTNYIGAGLVGLVGLGLISCDSNEEDTRQSRYANNSHGSAFRETENGSIPKIASLSYKTDKFFTFDTGHLNGDDTLDFAFTGIISNDEKLFVYANTFGSTKQIGILPRPDGTYSSVAIPGTNERNQNIYVAVASPRNAKFIDIYQFTNLGNSNFSDGIKIAEKALYGDKSITLKVEDCDGDGKLDFLLFTRGMNGSGADLNLLELDAKAEANSDSSIYGVE